MQSRDSPSKAGDNEGFKPSISSSISFDDFTDIEIDFAKFKQSFRALETLATESKLGKKVKDVINGEKSRLLKAYQKQRSRIAHRGDRIAFALKKRQQKLLGELKKPTFILTRDKMAFTLGVITTVATAFMMGNNPGFVPVWYLVLCTLLLLIRFFMYHMSRYHYFMLDFCYLSNVLLLFYLFYYPTSPFLYVLNFVNSNGPLLWAIVTWRNSLVFHSVDKVTSVFIHAYPPIVCYVLMRLMPNSGQHYSLCYTQDCTLSWVQVYVPHLIFFIFWQLSYLIKTEVIDRDLLEQNQEIITSFRWLTKDEKAGVGKIVRYFGPKYKILCFAGLQIAFHALTVIPVKFMYENETIHTMVLIGVLCWCVWNGANFYMDKFSLEYYARIRDITKQLEEEELFKAKGCRGKDVFVSSPMSTSDSFNDLSSNSNGNGNGNDDEMDSYNIDDNDNESFRAAAATDGGYNYITFNDGEEEID